MPRVKSPEPPKEEIINPYIPKAVTVTEFKRLSSDMISIKVDYKATHQPGQFVQVTIPGIGEAPISIASYSPDHIELGIREVGSVTHALSKLKKGDKLFIRGPYGNGYPMEKFKGKSLVLVGGGCGVSPLKGILAYVDKHKDDFQDVILYFGYRSPEDILYKDEMKQWMKKYSMHLSVDSNPKKVQTNFDVCFVTKLVEKAKLNPENKVVFLCGPPIMMNVTIDLLKEKGFTERQIYVSTERLMQCGLGICGHCMIHGKYTCLDGPVFRYDEISAHKDA